MDHAEEDEQMEEDEPYPEPRTLALTQRESEQQLPPPRREPSAREAQQRVPSEAT